MKSEIISAINQLCSEKNLNPEVVFDAVEAALLSAYKRSERGSGVAGFDIIVRMDRSSGRFQILRRRLVVAEVTDARTEMTLAEAQALDPTVTLGGQIITEIPPNKDFGRIAAQTAKQVILQRIREAERENLYSEYVSRAGDIVNGTVYRVEARGVVISLGKVEALMPPPEQMPQEYYRIGQRIRVYVLEVRRTNKGPQVIVSRTHPDLVRRLIEIEVPEVFSGSVEIKSIAREPGARSKVAVAAREAGVDPVGACVGIRGVRVQNVVSELGGEKVDIVAWSPDPGAFVANALSPARVASVTILKDENTAIVVVPDDQLSLAIGRAGQNARLAARLTGWRIDIKSVSEAREDEEWIAVEAGEEIEYLEEDTTKAGATYEEIIEYVEEIMPARGAQLPPAPGEIAAEVMTVEPAVEYTAPAYIPGEPLAEIEEEDELRRTDGKRARRDKRRRPDVRGPKAEGW